MHRSMKNLWITELVAATERSRWRPVVVTVEGPGELQRAIGGMGIEVSSLNSPSRLAYPTAVRRLAALVSHHHPQVIHSHLFDANLIATPLRRFRQVPAFVITRHEPPDFIRLADIATWKRVAVSAAARFAYASADAIVAPSHQTWEELRRDGVAAGKLHEIPIGLDTWKIDSVTESDISAARQELGLTGLSAITIARLSWEKNLLLLIRVWRDVVDRHPGAKLLIVGEGSQGEELRLAAASLGIERSVVFAGWRTDVYALLRAVDLMVHVSRTESTGMVLLEALAARKPLVATPVGVVGEYLRDGEHCLVVPHDDAAATLAAIERVVADRSLRSHLEHGGRRIVEEVFSMNMMAARYAELYDGLLSD
jgi:glycosyltransferase involved in cell wall biosynthesis